MEQKRTTSSDKFSGVLANATPIEANTKRSKVEDTSETAILSEWEVDAKQAIFMVMVTDIKDFQTKYQAFQSAPNQETFLKSQCAAFHPEFVHQMFPSDTITGYKNLIVVLWIHASSLKTLLETKFSQRRGVLDGGSDRVYDTLAQWFKTEKPFTTPQEFEQALQEKPFLPYGKIVASQEQKNRKVEAYLCRITTDFLPMLWRMHFFTFCCIKKACFIFPDDPQWQVFYLLERLPDGDKILGFCTVHSYFSFPDKRRKRISQFVILPPYQRQSLGSFMYRTIFQHFQKQEKINRVFDITVEAPASRFTMMRDILDFETLKKAGYFQKVDFRRITTKNFLNEKLIQQIRSQTKITKAQIIKMFQIAWLEASQSDPEQQTRFRLQMKMRLRAKFSDKSSDWNQSLFEVKQQLHQSYQELHTEFQAVLKALQGRD